MPQGRRTRLSGAEHDKVLAAMVELYRQNRREPWQYQVEAETGIHAKRLQRHGWSELKREMHNLLGTDDVTHVSVSEPTSDAELCIEYGCGQSAVQGTDYCPAHTRRKSRRRSIYEDRSLFTV